MAHQYYVAVIDNSEWKLRKYTITLPSTAALDEESVMAAAEEGLIAACDEVQTAARIALENDSNIDSITVVVGFEQPFALKQLAGFDPESYDPATEDLTAAEEVPVLDASQFPTS